MKSTAIPTLIALAVATHFASLSAESPVFVSPPELIQESGAGEGPMWHPELGLLTSGDGHINRRDLDGHSSVHRKDAGTNGLLFDRQGRLIACENVRRRITRTEVDGTITVLTDSFGGKKYNQPNDLTIDSKDRIYFTDPQYGDRSGMEMTDADGRMVEGIYRIDVDGTVTRIIDHQVDRPNGLIITSDDRYLFVADNNNAENGARKLWRFVMNEDGTPDFATQTMIYDWKTTRGPDGMKLDKAGRLYVAAGLNQPRLPAQTADPATAGIYVFATDGKLIDFAAILRDETTNCAFGGPDGKTLFVTAGGSLWRIPTSTAGYAIYSPTSN
ncbi:Gluconolactonase precursor [Rubripirellula tenax]|uniref:Gluconolactonase n=1 Tax=Rubripirellula tenax TaxID=2528015 RepID=A0A5C6FFH1_9BACT|nr:SMP-30/gluconolactonase/LRE family protein [Rubripirellula tenax]TWU60158.1 Gluconolactonase precursor [Rubripirellula tenax]